MIRAEIKEKALSNLKNNWINIWIIIFLVGLISAIATSIYNCVTYDLQQLYLGYEERLNQIIATNNFSEFAEISDKIFTVNAALGVYSFITVIASIIAFLFSVSMAQAFLKVAKGGVFELKDFKDSPKKFLDSFLLNLLIMVKIILWSLLFIIPGIIKAFAYSMANNIKAEHPEYGYNDCIAESQRIMYGHKMEYFVFHLSFIGWYILVALVLLLVGLIKPGNNFILLLLVEIITLAINTPLTSYVEVASAGYYLEITRHEREKTEEHKKEEDESFYSSYNGTYTERYGEEIKEKKDEPFSDL